MVKISMDELRADREAGTDGPWWTDAKYSGQDAGCSIIAARTDAGPLPGNPTRGAVAFATALLNTESRRCEANARRIARLPDLEAAYLEAVETLRVADDAIAEMLRYYDGGESRGSYDGKPERDGLRKAGYKTRATLAKL